MRPGPSPFILVLGALGLHLVATEPLAPQDSASEAPTKLEAFKQSLANMAEGVWMTSNAEYQEEDGGTEEYGFNLDLAPGGLAAVGCLWAETDQEVTGVYWHFFQAWDPVQEKGLIYQSSPWGAIAIGTEDPEADGPPMIQDMVAPDGTRTRIAHQEEWTDADTRVGGSLDWSDGRWVPRRNYTWVRDRDREAPCS